MIPQFEIVDTQWRWRIACSDGQTFETQMLVEVVADDPQWCESGPSDRIAILSRMLGRLRPTDWNSPKGTCVWKTDQERVLIDKPPQGIDKVLWLVFNEPIYQVQLKVGRAWKCVDDRGERAVVLERFLQQILDESPERVQELRKKKVRVAKEV